MKLCLYFEYIESTVDYYSLLYLNPLEVSLSLNRRLVLQTALWPHHLSDYYGNSTNWLLILLVDDYVDSIQCGIDISMSGCQVYGYSGLCSQGNEVELRYYFIYLIFYILGMLMPVKKRGEKKFAIAKFSFEKLCITK